MLEICVDTADAALLAQQSGADRIELCSSLLLGGLSPSPALISFCMQKIALPVRIMIRPRSGDFFYSEAEFNLMKKEIEMLKQYRPDGFVFGLLNADGKIDSKRTKELVEIANPVNVTFHRAFDVCRNPFDALEKIIECGCSTLLTSGQKNKATNGAVLIKKLVEQSNGRIEILIGSGVTDKNILALKNQTGARAFHMSARKKIKSNMLFHNSGINMEHCDDYFSVDREMIRRVKKIISGQ